MKKILLLLFICFSILLSSCGNKNKVKNTDNKKINSVETQESLGGKVKDSSSSKSYQDILIDNADTSKANMAPKKDIKTSTTTNIDGF